jgi:hypothetical protein
MTVAISMPPGSPSAPSAPTRIVHLHLDAPEVCPTCRMHLLDSESACDKCGEHYCPDCTCTCDHITTEHAMAVALQYVGRDPLISAKTVLVQDENGVAYAQSGPCDCFLVLPEYVGDCFDGVQLAPEFIRKHEGNQALAIETWQSRTYQTERFSVVIKPFDIEGRPFTASVFERKQ